MSSYNLVVPDYNKDDLDFIMLFYCYHIISTTIILFWLIYQNFIIKKLTKKLIIDTKKLEVASNNFHSQTVKETETLVYKYNNLEIDYKKLQAKFETLVVETEKIKQKLENFEICYEENRKFNFEAKRELISFEKDCEEY